MKKSFAIILGLALVAGFSSCSREEDDIFDDSPAHRLNQAIVENTKLLASAENGWVMEFVTKPDMPAYPLLCKFTEGGSVTFGANNDVCTNNQYKEVSSLFEIIGDNGPVLTFNTYNTILHTFSTPEDIPGTAGNEQGLGYEGDYEFVIYKAEEDHIVLRGKKYGYTINMFKLPADIAWEDYYTQLKSIRASYFSPKVKTMYLTTDKGNFTITGMGDGLFDFVPEGGDAISETITRPYTIRLDGSVYLNVPFKSADGSVVLQHFTPDENGVLRSTDEGIEASMTCGTPAFMLTNHGYKWRLDKNALAGDWLAAYDAMLAGIKKYKPKATMQYIELSWSEKLQSYNMLVKTSQYSLNYYISETGDNQSFKFGYEVDNCDNNAKVFYRDVAEVRDFIALLTSKTFALTANSPMSSTVITLAADNGNLTMNLQ